MSSHNYFVRFCPTIKENILFVRQPSGGFSKMRYNPKTFKLERTECSDCHLMTTEEDLYPMYAVWCEPLKKYVVFAENRFKQQIEQYVYISEFGGFEQVDQPELVYDATKQLVVSNIFFTVKATTTTGIAVIMRDQLTGRFRKEQYCMQEHHFAPKPTAPVKTLESAISFSMGTQVYERIADRVAEINLERAREYFMRHCMSVDNLEALMKGFYERESEENEEDELDDEEEYDDEEEDEEDEEEECSEDESCDDESCEDEGSDEEYSDEEEEDEEVEEEEDEEEEEEAKPFRQKVEEEAVIDYKSAVTYRTLGAVVKKSYLQWLEGLSAYGNEWVEDQKRQIIAELDKQPAMESEEVLLKYFHCLETVEKKKVLTTLQTIVKEFWIDVDSLDMPLVKKMKSIIEHEGGYRIRKEEVHSAPTGHDENELEAAMREMVVSKDDLEEGFSACGSGEDSSSEFEMVENDTD